MVHSTLRVAEAKSSSKKCGMAEPCVVMFADRPSARRAASATAVPWGTPIDTSEVVRWDRISVTSSVPRMARPRLAA